MTRQKNLLLILLTLSIFFVVISGIQLYKRNKISIKDICQAKKDNAEKILCFKSAIDSFLQKGDLDQSFDLVAEVYKQDLVFDANCHDFMHSIGKTAYELFSKGKQFKITAKASYCAYGFYHGFMENLVAEKGDVTIARNFCSYVDSQLSKETPGATLACYHGIGHGWTNVHDPAVWGNEEAMVGPAIKLCEKVTQDPEELKICATGVFDSISIGYYNQAYGLKINKKDPYWLCKKQDKKYQIPCYMDLTPAIVWLAGYRLESSLKYIKGVEQKYVDLVVQTIAEDNVRFIIRDQLNIQDQVKVCRNLGPNLAASCLHGLMSGYIQFGSPGQEENLVINFCSTETLTNTEKNTCFSDALKIMSYSFSKEKYDEICARISDQYKQYCIH